MHLRQGLSITISLIILASCSLDFSKKPTPPSWNVTLEMPLYDGSVGFKDFLQDSSITTEPTGSGTDSIFAFHENVAIDRVEVGDQLAIDDIHKSFSQSVDDVTIADNQIVESQAFSEVGVDPLTQSIHSEVGLIELNDIPTESTDPFQLNEIYPGINSVPDSTTTSIPSFDLTPQVKPFSFNDFDQATFTGGELSLTIVNNMPITLGTPITVQFLEISGPDTNIISGASVQFNSLIAPDDSSQGIMDLTGLTLPGNILIKVTGSSAGTEGNDITVDQSVKESAFYTRIAASGLQVTSAVAKVPEQVIQDTGAIEMAEDSTKVEDAQIRTGTMRLSVNNQMAINAVLDLTIPSLVDGNGTPFQVTSLNLSAGQPVQEDYSLDQYHMVMQLDSQKIEYSYEIHTEDTDPNLVQISETDSVVLNLDLFGDSPGSKISFSAVTGMIAPQHQNYSGSLDLSSDSEILEAQLSQGALDIVIQNPLTESQSGAPILNIVLKEIFTPSGDTLRLGPDLVLQPGENDFSVDLSGHSLRLPLDDQTLHYSATVHTNYGEVGIYNLLDSLNLNINVHDLAFSQVTGYFTQDAIVDSNGIDLNNATKVQQAELGTGQMELTVENHLGVLANVHFIINEFSKDGVGLDTSFDLNSSPDPQGIILPLEGYLLSMPLDSQMVHYVSRVSIPSDQEMTISFGDSLQVNVDMTDLSFQSVTGKIDPVHVNIDTVEQSITAFPDALQGIEFSTVNLDFHFNSDIGLPVYLTMNLTAENDAGETAVSHIDNWNIIENPVVSMPNAAELINIRPNKIMATGSAVVGDSTQLGTVATDQYLDGNLSIEIPLELILSGDSRIEGDATEMQSSLPSELEEMVLYAKVDNPFDFGTQIEVLVSPDTLNFSVNGPEIPDTLMTLDLLPSQTQLDSVVLDSVRIGWLSDSTYIKPIVYLIGNTDHNGVPIPSHFLSTDSLNIQLYGRVRALVDTQAGDQ